MGGGGRTFAYLQHLDVLAPDAPVAVDIHRVELTQEGLYLREENKMREWRLSAGEGAVASGSAALADDERLASLG